VGRFGKVIAVSTLRISPKSLVLEFQLLFFFSFTDQTGHDHLASTPGIPEDPGVHSVSNRNEYQKQKNNVSGK
jgi:hypothetical protein